TVQDLLSDPPFAQLDFVSCRNLLIYLLPEAQERVLSLLHFALRKDGVLVLGTAEALGALREGFSPVADDLRIFRRAGTGRKFSLQTGFNARPRGFWPRPAQNVPSREPNVGETAQRMLLDVFAPPSVLVNHRYEVLF